MCMCYIPIWSLSQSGFYGDVQRSVGKFVIWDGVSIHPNVNRIPIWINSGHVVVVKTHFNSDHRHALSFLCHMTLVCVFGCPNLALDDQ